MIQQSLFKVMLSLFSFRLSSFLSPSFICGYLVLFLSFLSIFLPFHLSCPHRFLSFGSLKMPSSLCPYYGHSYSFVYTLFQYSFLPSSFFFGSLLLLFHFILNSLPSPLVSPSLLCLYVDVWYSSTSEVLFSFPFSPLFLFFPGLPLLLLLIRVNLLSIISPSLTFFLLHSFLSFFRLSSLFRLLDLISFPSP